MAGADKNDDRNRKFWARAADAPAWYIVEAVEGKEFELSVALASAFSAGAGRDEDVLHLVDVVRFTRRIRAGGMMQCHPVIRKISRFGPLIFVRCRLTQPLAASLFHMPQAKGLLRCRDSQRPVVVSDAMIEFYKQTAPFGAVVKACEFEVGDLVRILAGPATGMEGVVERVDNGRSLRLDMGATGGSAPIVIEAGHVEIVAKSHRTRSISTSKRKAGRQVA